MVALLVVAAVLYFHGYWDPREETEETGTPQQVTITDAAPRILYWDPRPKSAPPGDPLFMLSEPSPLASNDTSDANRESNDLADRAVQSYNEGNYETAVNLFTELSKEDNQAFLGLGISYYRLGDYRSAVRFLESSIGIEGVDSFQVHKILAYTYYKLDDLDESLRNARAATAIRSDADLNALISKLSREKAVQGDFIEEDTLHFRAMFDGYEFTDQARAALNILEEAYGNVGVQLNHFPRDPITVILYTNKDFYDVTLMPYWSGGIYDGKIRIPLKGVEHYNTESLRRVLYHEYAHALIFSITHSCPKWVNEGLAVYLSGEKRNRVGQEIPLSDLENSFPDSEKDGGLAYDVSYSAVSYLVEKHGIYSFYVFLSELSKGKDTNTAFTSAFLIPYSQFADTWGGG